MSDEFSSDTAAVEFLIRCHAASPMWSSVKAREVAGWLGVRPQSAGVLLREVAEGGGVGLVGRPGGRGGKCWIVESR